MPGKTTHEAVERFLEPLRVAVTCLGPQQLQVIKSGKQYALDEPHVLTWNRGLPVPMTTSDGRRIELALKQSFSIVHVPDNVEHGPYKVKTLSYAYSISREDQREIIAWHWHPDAPSWQKTPHLHVGSTQLADNAVISNHHHLPTGRVSVEGIIRLAINDLGVRPAREDWQEKLMESEFKFQLHRSWS
jgi:hypothetical protein